MPELLEAIMVVCFGLSWPLSILKSMRARTAKGKSPFFLSMILLGYGAGIASKLTAGVLTYVFFFYVLNFCMVAVDLGLYVRNARLDRGREGV
jgi:hypothetical protein